jgi:Flp pilus assembly protein TadG
MTTHRRSRRLRTPAAGQSLVEFALVFPIAIIMLLAVFDVGRAVFSYNSLTNGAREGARLAAVNQDKGLIVERIQDQAFAIALSNAANPNDVVAFHKQLPNADAATNPVCTTMATGCVAIVTAEATWSAITPIIGQLVGPIDFLAESQVPVEFVCPNASITAYATSDLCPLQP